MARYTSGQTALFSDVYCTIDLLIICMKGFSVDFDLFGNCHPNRTGQTGPLFVIKTQYVLLTELSHDDHDP